MVFNVIAYAWLVHDCCDLILDKEITGGKIKVEAKYGIITVFDHEYDACDLLKQIGKECPIPAGKMNICV